MHFCFIIIYFIIILYMFKTQKFSGTLSTVELWNNITAFPVLYGKVPWPCESLMPDWANLANLFWKILWNFFHLTT